jgi:hypothetical protein
VVRIVVLAAAFLLVACAGCKRSKKPALPLLPYATVEAPGGVQEGVFEIAYTVYDPFENPVDVLVEFATDGYTFGHCTRAPGGTPVTGLATASTGLSYTFRWNSVADSVALASQVDTVRIRVTPSQLSGRGLPVAGYPGTSDEFSVDNTAANTPPVVEITTSPGGIQSGDVTVEYSITDAEADTGYIEVLFTTGAMADWQPATLASASGGTIEGNLVVNMTCPIPPAVRDIVWDSLTDLGTTYAHEVQIRIIGHDTRAGAPADTSLFRIDNTPAAVPPVLTLTTPASPSRGLVRLEYDISDNNAEAANIVFEVSLDGGIYQVPEIVYSDAGQRCANVITNVPCLPAPQTYHIVWDSAADVGFAANYQVRFRARPESSLYGTWAETADFAVDNSSPAGAPGAVITADRTDIQTGETINFSAMSSTGSPTTFLWDFGDGSYSAATEPAHTYDTGPGEFTALLTVTNAASLSDTAALKINVIEDMTDNYVELVPYRNYYETRETLEALAAANPGIMTIYTAGYSVEGREIFVVKISDNVEVDEDEPTVHFDAQHHAREVMTPEVIIDIAEQLVSNYGSSSEITGWVDSYEIYLMPCVNPDGVVAVFTTDWGIRKNARGVDPNRNYPADWGNPDGSSSNPGSQTYRGPFPASEPEVQTLMAQTLKTRPVAAITFHSYSNIVLYPYGSPGLTQTSQEDFITLISEAMAASMVRDIGGPYLAQHTLWYDASGTTFDWMYRDVGTVCVLVEVGDAMGGGLNGFHPDYATYHDPQIQGVRPGVAELLRFVGRGAICEHVTDDSTGEPLETDISVSGFTSYNSEIRRSEPQFGSFYYLWENGTYSVTFTREGYDDLIVSSVTVASAPCVLDVQLVRKAMGNHRPTADFYASVEQFEVGSTIFLDGTGSTDEDGDTLTYYWNFGDNETSSLPAPAHTFNRSGTHRVVLKVDDGNGGEHETWKLVHVMPILLAPHVTLQPVTGTWSRDVCVYYGLKAPAPSDCTIALEYTLDGLVWHPATIAGADEGWISANTVSSIATATELASHYFLWDSLTDLGAAGPTVVALKVVPYIPGQAYGDPAITNLFTVDNAGGNSPPSVTLAAQAPPLFNDVSFNGTISDPDYESCSLTIEYSLDSGGSWNPATLVSCQEGIIISNVITGLAASPAGTAYSFVWDGFADLGANHVTGIWVCATPNDSETNGASALVTGLEINNVGLVVTSPVITDIIDTNCSINWLWDSTSGSAEGDLVYEIDYALGVGTVYFYDDFRLRPQSDWELTGDTYWHEGGEMMVLDRDAGGAGGLWYTGDILATEWYCSFRFRITGGPGARGFYFSFYSEPTTSQYPPDGYTIEFDANYNSGVDPYNVRHIALLDASGTHLCYAVNNDFSDGSWHKAEVYYKNGLLIVDMDGSNVLGYWIAAPDMSHLRFGFGGRHHAGRTYYIDDVFLSEHKPVWYQFVTTAGGAGTSGGTGSYAWDTSGISSGSGCVIRIRGYDGSSHKSYSFSEPFLIEHPGTPTVNLTDPTGIQRYEVSLEFTLDDPTDDICSVGVEYRPDSAGSWFDATIKSTSAGAVDGSTVTGLASGTTETYTVVWDAWHDLGEVNNTGARLRLTPKDTLAGMDSETIDFTVDNTVHPGELTGFAATAVGGTTVVLDWTNPAAPSLHKIVIVRSESGFPADPTDGTVVFDSTDTGFYFDNQDLDGAPAFIRQDNAIDFDWDAGSPDAAIPDDHFSICWTAAMDLPAAGPWNFHTLSEDGVRLYVDGDLIIDRWVSRAASEYCGYKMLGAGRHRLVLEYFHNVGGSEAHLYFTGPGASRSVTPLQPGQPVSFTDVSVSPGTTYYYTGFTYTPGGTFSTGGPGASDSITP